MRQIFKQAVVIAIVMFVFGLAACAVGDDASDQCTDGSCQMRESELTAGVAPDATDAQVVQVPLELQQIGDGPITNTTCVYQPNCKLAWLDEVSQNRGCTQGCGGPAVCADFGNNYYWCGYDDGSECSVLTAWTTDYPIRDCPAAPAGKRRCWSYAFTINVGQCVRSSGLP